MMKLLVKATGFILVALGLTGATKAESSCLAAVAQQAGSSEGSIISAERGENATIVLVPVPGAQAPRRCKYGATGVQRVFYTGEG